MSKYYFNLLALTVYRMNGWGLPRGQLIAGLSILSAYSAISALGKDLNAEIAEDAEKEEKG